MGVKTQMRHVPPTLKSGQRGDAHLVGVELSWSPWARRFLLRAFFVRVCWPAVYLRRKHGGLTDVRCVALQRSVHKGNIGRLDDEREALLAPPP